MASLRWQFKMKQMCATLKNTQSKHVITPTISQRKEPTAIIIIATINQTTSRAKTFLKNAQLIQRATSTKPTNATRKATAMNRTYTQTASFLAIPLEIPTTQKVWISQSQSCFVPTEILMNPMLVPKAFPILKMNQNNSLT